MSLKRRVCSVVLAVSVDIEICERIQFTTFDDRYCWRTMSIPEFTEILRALESGNSLATDRLLPVVYDELRQLAAVHLAREKPGLTLQPTALVHEAYVRLVGGKEQVPWSNRSHFFGAAGQAMRRILIDHAREKQSLKRGGELQRLELDDQIAVDPPPLDDLVALDEALHRLKEIAPKAVELVQLRYFAGLTAEEAADVMGISTRSAGSLWAYARAWLREALEP